MPVFNALIAVEPQLTDFSCSVGATFWCLRSIGETITQDALQALMVPELVSPDDGLLDGSGATIAALLTRRFGLKIGNQRSVTFDEVAERAGSQPMLIGGHRWFVAANGAVTGHWVAVRRFDGERILLANPGGTGPKFGQQSLDRSEFADRAPFSAVWIESAGDRPTAPAQNLLRMRVANTSGEGANLRAEPRADATRVAALAEGADVQADERAWREVVANVGPKGWVAAELVVAEGDRFRVSGTSGQGANVRAAPAPSAERVGGLAEDAIVECAAHAWRRVTDTAGNTGWMVDQFLVLA